MFLSVFFPISLPSLYKRARLPRLHPIRPFYATHRPPARPAPVPYLIRTEIVATPDALLNVFAL